MKLLLFCDDKVGSTIAEWLFENYKGDVYTVVTMSENAAYLTAHNNGIHSVVFETEAQLLSVLSRHAPFDLGILAWWPKLISTKIIALTKCGIINTHPSLLPYNRGKHYNFWALVEEAPFGVSLHFVDEGIDSGDIVAQKTIEYDWEDTAETLHSKAIASMIELFISTYPKIRRGTLRRVPQDLTIGSIHYKTEIEESSVIDLERLYSARELINLLRARTFRGHPGCRFISDGEIYEIRVEIKKYDGI
jgi:methionyl-tRNA formyltransferase